MMKASSSWLRDAIRETETGMAAGKPELTDTS